MKILRLYMMMLWLAVAATAAAQGRGVAEGRLVNGTDPAIVAGNAELEILELSSGMNIIKTAKTDERGMFRIEELPDAMPLMLRAFYKGANYHGMLRFDADGKTHMELEVYEPTASMDDIRVEAANMAFQLTGNHLHAIETFVFVNSTSPPRIYINTGGSFRISKAPGVLEPPQIRITAPGAEMPLTQSALESFGDESYYSIYPLRPGGTIFEVHQTLPYIDEEYVYERRFFHDIPNFSVGVIPFDMTLSGNELKKTEEHTAENFSIYSGGAVRAGDTVVWTFTGGTPTASDHEDLSDVRIIAMDGVVGRNALTIGAMIMTVFIIALLFALNRPASATEPESRIPRKE